MVRRFLIEFVHSVVFLVAFHFIAASTFEMFVVFGLFTIFLKVRTDVSFAELRAQNYLLMRNVSPKTEELANIAKNMEAAFAGREVLSEFSDENIDEVNSDYNGHIFSRFVSVLAQGWMLVLIGTGILWGS